MKYPKMTPDEFTEFLRTAEAETVDDIAAERDRYRDALRAILAVVKGSHATSARFAYDLASNALKASE